MLCTPGSGASDDVTCGAGTGILLDGDCLSGTAPKYANMPLGTYCNSGFGTSVVAGTGCFQCNAGFGLGGSAVPNCMSGSGEG